MTDLLSISVAMFAGLMMTRALKKLHLPDVTAYLVAGVLIGPCLLGALKVPGLGFNSYEQLDGLSVISDLALGFIAFSIGNEFRLEQLKETGRQAFIVGIAQAVVTTIVVDLALLLVHFCHASGHDYPGGADPGGHRRRHRPCRHFDGGASV